MKKDISIMLVDDHKMVREGLKSLIEQQPNMVIVAEASSGARAIECAKKQNIDVVVMDISMEDISGLEATKEILKFCPRTKVLILSMHADRRFVTEALNIGAAGYVLKDSAAEELLFAIRKVYADEIFLSAKITEVIVKDYLSTRSILSAREREVLKYIAEGMATKEIASELGLSAKTVEAHRHQIMEKLDIHSIAELTKYAIKEGLTNV
jgi:DNA-binding NarL/FixJ family response regulator